MNKDNIKNTNNTNQTDDRAGKLKLYSIGSVVLLIAIILIANILFDAIFGKALSFDFSDSLQNSISQASVDYIDSLPADTRIRIVGLFERPDNVSGTPYQYIIPLLDDYVRKSDGKISVEYVDMTTNPSIITQLDPANAYNLSSKSDSFVVSYNGMLKTIAPLDCYSYDQNMYLYYGKYYINGNNAEFTFTNTMSNLTNNYSLKAYIVTGLKESGNVYISRILDSMSYEVAELPASDNFAIPEDCDILILNGPNSDISEKMYVAMNEYLKNGGKLFVAVNYDLDNVSETYPRLNTLLNTMNINIDPALVSENDPGYQLGGYSIDSTVIATGEFSGFADISYLHSTYARSVRILESSVPGIDTYPVLLTSNKASVVELDELGNSIDNGIVSEGQYSVAAYSSSRDANPAKAFVFGTLTFTSDDYISEYGLNDVNVDFFKSCIRELSSSEPVNVLNIPVKQTDNFMLDPEKATTSASNFVMVIFMIAVPVLLVAMAVIVYFKRKNL